MRLDALRIWSASSPIFFLTSLRAFPSLLSTSLNPEERACNTWLCLFAPVELVRLPAFVRTPVLTLRRTLRRSPRPADSKANQHSQRARGPTDNLTWQKYLYAGQLKLTVWGLPLSLKFASVHHIYSHTHLITSAVTQPYRLADVLPNV